MDGDLDIHARPDYVVTKGLSKFGQQEIRLAVTEHGLLPAAERYLRRLMKYIETSGARLHAGDTIPYGYWLLKFVGADSGVLDAWEMTEDGEEFVCGVTRAARYWRCQRLTCQQYNAQYAPPCADKLCAMMPEVLDRGRRVCGARYPSPEHMSGWWLTTPEYSGDVSELSVRHLFHVTHAVRELAKFLALPFGYCFECDPQGERVWFEEQIAKQEPASEETT